MSLGLQKPAADGRPAAAGRSASSAHSDAPLSQDYCPSSQPPMHMAGAADGCGGSDNGSSSSSNGHGEWSEVPSSGAVDEHGVPMTPARPGHSSNAGGGYSGSNNSNTSNNSNSSVGGGGGGGGGWTPTRSGQQPPQMQQIGQGRTTTPGRSAGTSMPVTFNNNNSSSDAMATPGRASASTAPQPSPYPGVTSGANNGSSSSNSSPYAPGRQAQPLQQMQQQARIGHSTLAPLPHQKPTPTRMQQAQNTATSYAQHQQYSHQGQQQQQQYNITSGGAETLPSLAAAYPSSSSSSMTSSAVAGAGGGGAMTQGPYVTAATGALTQAPLAPHPAAATVGATNGAATQVPYYAGDGNTQGPFISDGNLALAPPTSAAGGHTMNAAAPAANAAAAAAGAVTQQPLPAYTMMLSAVGGGEAAGTQNLTFAPSPPGHGGSRGFGPGGGGGAESGWGGGGAESGWGGVGTQAPQQQQQQLWAQSCAHAGAALTQHHPQQGGALAMPFAVPIFPKAAAAAAGGAATMAPLESQSQLQQQAYAGGRATGAGALILAPQIASGASQLMTQVPPAPFAPAPATAPSSDIAQLQHIVMGLAQMLMPAAGTPGAGSSDATGGGIASILARLQQQQGQSVSIAASGAAKSTNAQPQAEEEHQD